MTPTDAAVLPPSAHLELVAEQVAQQAARFVRSHVGRARAAGTKSTPTDVVTDTDLASEELIRNELRSRCPGSTIVGEELDDHVGPNDVGWIVDPIDGTVNFLYGLPVISVSIAATIGGKIVAGAVTDVLSGDTFAARLHGGAKHNGSPISVASSTELAASLIGTGFSYESSVRAEQAVALGSLLPACRDIRCMGSAALNLCWVGAGLLDGYFERNIKPYDYAAGALIATEAGAIVDLPDDGGPGLTLAAAPGIIDALRTTIG